MPTPALPDSLRNRYELRGRLGAGGMGEVLEVRDALLGEDVALKLVRSDRRAEDARLLEEFGVLASLDHPGVVGVREVGVAGDAVYMTTSLLQGDRLDVYLDTDPPLHEVEGVLENILGTLAWLHGHGLVHGDIKPANILVLEGSGRPWPVLIDFGLAHRIGAKGGPVGGTPGYMAPELLGRGRKRPSERSDLYALGRCFESWAERHGKRPSGSLVKRMMKRHPTERPQDADDALGDLGLGEIEHRLGGRGLLALWDRTLTTIRDKVGQGGSHIVDLPGGEDCRPFAHALKASLEVSGRAALVVPRDPGPPLEVWKRLLTCLGHGAAVELDRLNESIHAPEGHSEALEAFAFRVVECLRNADPGCILVPEPGDLSGPDQHVLRRCVESGVGRALVVVSGADDPRAQWLVDDAPAGTERHTVATPGKRQVRRFLRLHGVDDQPEDAILALVTARAQRGAAGLRSLLGFWAESGLLLYASGGRWTWNPQRDPSEVDAPDLDMVWRHLWSSLAQEDQTVLANILSLGGAATGPELITIAPNPKGVLSSLTRLAQAGWTRSGRAGCIRLAPMVMHRFGDGRLTVPDQGAAQLERAIQLIKETEGDTTPQRQRALATLLEESNRPGEASEMWARVGDRGLQRLDTAGAGFAYLRCACTAVESERDDLAQEAFVRVVQAARLLEVVGDEPGLDQAMQLARQIASGQESRETEARVRLLEAHVALHRGALDQALERLGEALAGLEGHQGDNPAFRLDVSLIKGSALAAIGRTSEAVEALSEAADQAEALGDLHAAGRVSNNLGNVHLRLEQARRAEEAYARSASIKERTGDARGRRIAQSNRVLALRQSGDLAQAATVMMDTLALAERLGDRRGIVTARLVLTLLALELGQLPWAEAEMAAMEGLETGSAIAALNVQMARVRLAMARGDEPGAAVLAERLHSEARDRGIESAALEAWGLLALARLRQQAETLGPDGLDEMIRSADEWLATAHKAGRQALVPRACRIYALALSGQWAQARDGLEAALEETLESVTPDTSWVLGLLSRAARLVGAEDTREALFQGAARLFQTRQRAWQQLRTTEVLAEHRPASLSQVKTAMGIDDLLVSPDVHSTSEPEMDPMLQREKNMIQSTPDPALHALTVAVGGLPEDSFTEPRSWARALRRASGANAATLVSFSSSTVEILSSSPDEGVDADRISALAEAARGNLDPFVGRGRDGALEVLGLPLGHGGGEEPLGVVMMVWEDGTAEEPSSVVGRLTHTARLAALIVEREALMSQHSALKRRVHQVTEESTLMAEAHADELSRLRDALHHTQTEVELRHSYDHIIHRSRPMRRVLRTLDKVTDSDVTVMVLGESGVGKEVLSRALHHNGPRSSGPFVAENCGAIPAELFESVFFGHVRGAFTGANTTQRGLVEQARGGTLFLDEVGELRPEHQVKLLRVLQERRFRPVGAAREIEADFRLVAATNRDLEAMVTAGEFREDLFYRLSVVRVEIPPLRERREDIMPLLTLFLDKESKRGGERKHLSTAAADLLTAYDWPGNVREMENEMLRASVLADGQNVEPRHLSTRVRGGEKRGRDSTQGGVAWDGQAPLDQVLGHLEQRVIEQALALTGGKKAPAARMLGISRPGLDAKLERHGIDVARFRASSRRALATR